MSIWDSRGRRRAVARKLAPYLGVALSGVIFVVTVRCLWLAYTDHAIFLPLPRRAHYVVLEQEPAFFWIAVAFYVLAAVCAPLAVVSDIDDIRFRLRHRKS